MELWTNVRTEGSSLTLLMHSAMAERTTAFLLLLPPEVPMWKMLFCAFIFSLLFTKLQCAPFLAMCPVEFVNNVTLL